MSTPVDDLTRMDAVALATALTAREVSSEEVTRAHLDRIAAVDGAVHAFLHVAGDAATATAEAIDRRRAAGSPLGALDGVPIAVKDVLATRGLPTRAARRSSRAGCRPTTPRWSPG